MGRTNPKHLKEAREKAASASSSNTKSSTIYRNHYLKIRNVTRPAGKMCYGLFMVANRTPVFVGVAYNHDSNHLYRFEREKKGESFTPRFKCRDCHKTMSANANGLIKHGEVQRVSAKGVSCLAETEVKGRRKTVRKAVQFWAAFQARLEALANDRNTISREEFAAWMKKGGQSSPFSPSEKNWNEINNMVDRFLAAKQFNEFIDNISEGQKLVQRFNKKETWQCERTEDSVLFSDEEELEASEEEIDLEEDQGSEESNDAPLAETKDDVEELPATPDQATGTKGKGSVAGTSRMDKQTPLPSTSVSSF
jgi:arsenate reductase-like glutaredoxin family protein